MSKPSLRIIVTGLKKKRSYKASYHYERIYPIITTDADYNYILDEIYRRGNFSLEGM